MPQISATISEELMDEIKKVASKDRRTISSVVELLVERAIKERNRKTKIQSNVR